MAFRFSKMRSVCFAVSPSIGLPVEGSNAVWPEININPFALIACEYGPIALGPFSVEMTSRILPPQTMAFLVFPGFCVLVLFLEFRRNARVVDPGAKHGREIIIRYVLKCCSDVTVTDFLTTQEAPDLR